MVNVAKSIKILLCISGIYIIYSLIATFFIIPETKFYWLAYSVGIFFEIVGFSSGILVFVFFLLFFGLAIFDFIFALSINQSTKVFMVLVFSRSLIGSLCGIFLISIGLYILFPFDLNLTLEGFLYFIFYSTIVYLLILKKRRAVL